MNEQLLNTISELIRQGGTLAVWLVLIIQLSTLLKSILELGTVIIAIKIVASAIFKCLKNCRECQGC
jgi:hypothetical protein